MNFGCAAVIEFWYWTAANSCCHFLKKPSTYQRGCRGNRVGMCQFLLFLHSLSHFSTRYLKNRGGMLYFPLRLYNCVCIFSIFYRSWIHRGWTTVLV